MTAMPVKRILVIDNEVYSGSGANLPANSGWQVVTAAGSGEGLNKGGRTARCYPLDVMMPDMDGPTFQNCRPILRLGTFPSFC